MQNTQIVVQEKNGKTMLARAGVMLLPLVAMGAAHAEVDTAATVTAITGLGAGVAAIGGAILLILVAIKGYSLIKRAL